VLVYLITNLINGKRYVGQTTRSVEARWKSHTWACTLVKPTMPVTKAIKKYGKSNFKIEILQHCTSQEDTDAAEIHFATTLSTFVPKGYNLRAGKARGVMIEEVRLRIGQGNQGKMPSLAARQNMSKAHTGVPLNALQLKKLKERRKGKSLSPGAQERAVDVVTAKSARTFISPDGNRIFIKNMAAFCKANNLTKGKMCELGTGKRKMYRGWTLANKRWERNDQGISGVVALEQTAA